MLPCHSLDQFLQPHPADLQEIVLELRNIVVAAAPDAAETLHWYGLSYYHGGGGGPVSAGICQIAVHADHVRLGFVHGAFLPDPKRLLEGDRKYKRFVRIHSYEDAPWDDLKDLIMASSRFDPYTLQMRPFALPPSGR
jgi:hypothetical protein